MADPIKSDAEKAIEQFRDTLSKLRGTWGRMMNDPDEKESLRHDIAGLQGIPPSMVKFEGEE